MINTAKVNITTAFKGMDSSEAIKDYAQKRGEKLAKFLQHLTTLHYVFFVEKTDHVTQVNVTGGDFEAHAESRAANMYAAIDEVTEKLVHQLQKHKEKIKNHTGRPHHNSE